MEQNGDGLARADFVEMRVVLMCYSLLPPTQYIKYWVHSDRVFRWSWGGQDAEAGFEVAWALGDGVVVRQLEVLRLHPLVKGSHDGQGVVGVLQTKGVAQLVDCHQEELGAMLKLKKPQEGRENISFQEYVLSSAAPRATSAHSHSARKVRLQSNQKQLFHKVEAMVWGAREISPRSPWFTPDARMLRQSSTVHACIVGKSSIPDTVRAAPETAPPQMSV
ncbi:hypothetical protein FQN60_011314, partial [Etheostoma spectabile]